jgi:predicted SAM-dependent methyltransferase
MATEASKAMDRRTVSEYGRYFVGAGIDIGAGPDSIGRWKSKFTDMESVRAWDMPDGDAQYLASIDDNTFDFAHSSHCLEHMRQWDIALSHWTRVVRPGGYLIITIPDWRMYEHRKWPSRFNSDHKWAFSMTESSLHAPVVRITKHELEAAGFIVHKLWEVTNGFDDNLPDIVDQTAYLTNAECAIEMVLEKRPGVYIYK